MKKSFLALAVVAVAAVFSAFTTTKTVDTWYQYTQTSNTLKLDPSKYNLFGTSTPTNPANILNVVAFIKVDASAEVYPSDYSVTEHRDKPMVDVVNSQLQIDINSATSSPFAEIANRIMLK